jgi:hypothetical protein
MKTSVILIKLTIEITNTARGLNSMLEIVSAKNAVEITVNVIRAQFAPSQRE